MAKIKWSLVFGAVATLLFAGLLAVRLGVFEEEVRPVADTKTATVRLPETWMNIYQNRKKIGVIHREFRQLTSGRFQTAEKVTLALNTMGIPQVLHVATETELNPDLSFSSFTFELTSSLFRFSARGFRSKDRLIIFSGLPSAQQKTVLPFRENLYVSGNIYESAFRSAPQTHTSLKFNLFDPSTLGIRSVSVTREADEVIPIMGKRVLTQKYCAEFLGARNCAWLDKTGEILKETGLLGLSMEKVSPAAAAEGLAAGSSVDFTKIASIPSNREIADPGALTELKLKIGGINGVFLLLSGGRQQRDQNILTITREILPDEEPAAALPPAVALFLKPSALAQSDAADIKKQAGKIVRATDGRKVRLEKIVSWVYRNLEKKPVLSVPNALEVLNLKAGDCNEHAVLTAALLRAAGVPAQIETGLVYQNGRFYYHAWNLAYIGRWVTADAVMNQIPADVTHIRLARGEGGQELSLLGVLGKIHLEVLSFKHD
ncbi:MAG: transglutaminase-like domain-containing protein [Smithellaceae bacterium]|nr:transglutaminase-like domain-containing protein [Smithellaceae bacterium]